MASPDQAGEPTFRDQLTSLINKNSLENASDTPDYILSEYLCRALESFDKAVSERETWYGRN